MSMMSRGAREANMESAARAGYGKVAEQAGRIALLEAMLRRMVDDAYADRETITRNVGAAQKLLS